MSMRKNGALIAAVVAGLISNVSYAADANVNAMSATVHCAGVNSCKGMGACKTAMNSCKSMNSCKGKGIVTNLTAKQCTDQGGTVSE